MGMDPDVVNPTKDNAANSYGTWSLQAAQKEALAEIASDPYFNSHSGYMIAHSEEEAAEKAAEPGYDFDPELDGDI